MGVPQFEAFVVCTFYSPNIPLYRYTIVHKALCIELYIIQEPYDMNSPQSEEPTVWTTTVQGHYCNDVPQSEVLAAKTSHILPAHSPVDRHLGCL